MLVYLMTCVGMRDLYEPSMESLQARLYQLSRLTYDALPRTYEHFEKHGLKPFLYAASWFLTLFASQLPMSFVCRVLDILLAEGIEIIFRAALALLHHHEERILRCSNFEQLVACLKTDIVKTPTAQLQALLRSALNAGWVVKHVTPRALAGYMEEYHVFRSMVPLAARGVRRAWCTATALCDARCGQRSKPDVDSTLARLLQENAVLRLQKNALERDAAARCVPGGDGPVGVPHQRRAAAATEPRRRAWRLCVRRTRPWRIP